MVAGGGGNGVERNRGFRKGSQAAGPVIGCYGGAVHYNVDGKRSEGAAAHVADGNGGSKRTAADADGGLGNGFYPGIVCLEVERGGTVGGKQGKTVSCSRRLHTRHVFGGEHHQHPVVR